MVTVAGAALPKISGALVFATVVTTAVSLFVVAPPLKKLNIGAGAWEDVTVFP